MLTLPQTSKVLRVRGSWRSLAIKPRRRSFYVIAMAKQAHGVNVLLASRLAQKTTCLKGRVVFCKRCVPQAVGIPYKSRLARLCLICGKFGCSFLREWWGLWCAVRAALGSVLPEDAARPQKDLRHPWSWLRAVWKPRRPQPCLTWKMARPGPAPGSFANPSAAECV